MTSELMDQQALAQDTVKSIQENISQLNNLKDALENFDKWIYAGYCNNDMPGLNKLLSDAKKGLETANKNLQDASNRLNK